MKDPSPSAVEPTECLGELAIHCLGEPGARGDVPAPRADVHLPDEIGAKPQEVISHNLRKTPAATTAAANAKLPQSDSATSARRDHHTDRQPRPVATAAARAITPS